jgi:hypothetical protein
MITVWLAWSLASAAPGFDELSSATDWDVMSKKNVDSVGEIHVHGRDFGELRCLRANARADLPLELLGEVVSDVEGEVHWGDSGLKEARVHHRGIDSLDYYQYLDTPGWTFAADRFWFLRGTFHRSPGRVVFSWDRMGEHGGPHRAAFDAVVAAHPSAIEPPVNVGGWVFEQNGSAVDMTYYLCSDSGGAIPKGIQDWAAKNTVPTVVVDVVHEATRRHKLAASAAAQ